MLSTGKLFLAILFVTVFSQFAAAQRFTAAQTSQILGDLGREEKFFPIVSPFRNTDCLFIDERIYTKETLESVMAREQCKASATANSLDFTKQTVIGWRAGGDCHMQATPIVYRNDKEKIVTLLVNNRYGGCRAGGWRSGIVAIDKLPADYHVRIIEKGIDEIHANGEVGQIKSMVTWTADGRLVDSKEREELEADILSAKSAAKTAKAKSAGETEIRIVRRATSRRWACREEPGGVYTDADFQKVLANPDCGEAKLLGVDLKKETVLGVTARGDCHVSAETSITRNDASRTYSVRVNTIYGQCRAAGEYREWLVVDKFRPGYKVEWTNLKTDLNGVVVPEQVHYLPTNERFFDAGCFYGPGRAARFDIRSKEQLMDAFLKTADRQACMSKTEYLVNFEKESLIGIGLSSNYCNRPRGLAYKALRDDSAKTVTLHISYDDTKEMCRHMGYFDVWVVVPKIPEGYEVKYVVSTLAIEKDKQ